MRLVRLNIQLTKYSPRKTTVVSYIFLGSWSYVNSLSWLRFWYGSGNPRFRTGERVLLVMRKPSPCITAALEEQQQEAASERQAATQRIEELEEAVRTHSARAQDISATARIEEALLQATIKDLEEQMKEQQEFFLERIRKRGPAYPSPLHLTGHSAH